MSKSNKQTAAPVPAPAEAPKVEVVNAEFEIVDNTDAPAEEAPAPEAVEVEAANGVIQVNYL